MRTVPVRSVGVVPPSTLQTVADTFGACHTLADLLRWTGAHRPPVQVAEIVTQDEYTHDVVLPFGTAFLSFDTT